MTLATRKGRAEEMQPDAGSPADEPFVPILVGPSCE